jgi:hypothetical protein
MPHYFTGYMWLDSYIMNYLHGLTYLVENNQISTKMMIDMKKMFMICSYYVSCKIIDQDVCINSKIVNVVLSFSFWEKTDVITTTKEGWSGITF